MADQYTDIYDDIYGVVTSGPQTIAVTGFAASPQFGGANIVLLLTPQKIFPTGFQVPVTFGVPTIVGATPDTPQIISPWALGIGTTFGVPFLNGGIHQPPIINPPPVILQPFTNSILMGAVPVRYDRFTFTLLDKNGRDAGAIPLAEDAAPTLQIDVDRTTVRSVSGLTIYRTTLMAIDVETERLAIGMTLQNGEAIPLGVYMFGEDHQGLASYGSAETPDVFDETFLLDQPLDVTVAAPVGASVYDLIAVLLEPFPEFNTADGTLIVEPPDVAVASPQTFLVGSSRYAALKICADLLGAFPPTWDNRHRLLFKSSGTSGDTHVDFTYDAGSIILDESPKFSSSTYKVPNRFIVVGSDPGTPVVGVYDLPDSAPHSFAQRGRRVSTSRTVQGITSQEAAEQTAYLDALQDPTPYGHIALSTTANPFHDVYNVMQVLGVRYLERSWRLQLVNGGEHEHEGVTLWPV